MTHQMSGETLAQKCAKVPEGTEAWMQAQDVEELTKGELTKRLIALEKKVEASDE